MLVLSSPFCIFFDLSFCCLALCSFLFVNVFVMASAWIFVLLVWLESIGGRFFFGWGGVCCCSSCRCLRFWLCFFFFLVVWLYSVMVLTLGFRHGALCWCDVFLVSFFLPRYGLFFLLGFLYQSALLLLALY